jgi:predicted Holliday junction resolvase-like endonuclease
MIIYLTILLAILVGISIFLVRKLKLSKEAYIKLLSQKKSSEVVLGQIAEQLAPFTNNFKYDPHLVKFLGQPIDYIYFGTDKIVIIEVKSGNAKLNARQAQLKKLVNTKQVFWEEYRIPDKLKPTASK